MVSDASLYARLGRREGITRITDRYVQKLINDETLNFFRSGTDGAWTPSPERIELLKARMTQIICMLSGGPEVYEGADLRTAHEPLEISQHEFDRALFLLGATAEELALTRTEGEALLSLLRGTRRLVVSRIPTIKEAGAKVDGE